MLTTTTSLTLYSWICKRLFDTVSHNELLFKLHTMGISGCLLSRFKCYLSNRLHRVKLDSYCSGDLPVTSGVPQGSILGPILFLVYINDLFSAITSANLFLFADDSQCFRQIKSITDSSLLQSNLDAITDWSVKWNMKYNVSKCAHLRFGTNIVDQTYTLNGISIPATPTFRDVGILLSSDLTFTSHLHHVISKAYMSLGMLRRTIPSINDVALKKTLYLTLVRSHLVYCSQIRRPFLIKDSRTLEQLQRRASKYILNNFHLDYKSRLIQLCMLPLTLWLELQDIFLFLSLFKNPPDNICLSDYVQFITSTTRSSSANNIRSSLVHSPRLNITRHFYFNRLPRLWNSLPHVELNKSLKALRNDLYILYWNYSLTKYDPHLPCTWYRVCPCNSCASLPVHSD